MSISVSDLASLKDFQLRPEWKSDSFAKGAQVVAPSADAEKKDDAPESTLINWPTGSLVYERDWLLKFRPNSLTPPTDLPKLPVVCPPEEQKKLLAVVMQQQSDLQKQFQQQKHNTKIKPQFKQRNKKTTTTNNANGNAPLVKGEDRWLPSTQDKKKPAKTMEQNFLSNLNKLTLETFTLLSRHLAELIREASSAEQLQRLVHLVVDKAIAEQKFSTMYAQLCAILIAHAPYFEKHGGENVNKVTFHAELLNHCQFIFREEHGDDIRAFVKKQLPENAANDEIEEAEVKFRARMLGNIKFLGELYKLRLLKEKIMRKWIIAPLEHTAMDDGPISRREIAVEKLGKLLMIIGETLDKSDGTELIFANIKALAVDKALSSRHRFLLLDLLDMRTNGWVARRPQDNPQRISEVHNDADDYSYSLPAELLTGIAAAAAALPRPTGEPSREQLEGGWVRFVPGGGNNKSDDNDDETSSTATASSKKKNTRKVSFETPQKSAEDQVASMIEEYFSSHDTEEATLAFSELGDDYEENLVLVLAEAANALSGDANLIASLFGELKNKNKKMKEEIFSKAFNSFLDLLPDLAVDAPNAPKFAGKVIKACVAKKVIASSLLTDNATVKGDDKLASKIKDAMK